MISTLALLCWSALGVRAVIVQQLAPGDRAASLPLALILGPFWYAVAFEQRQMEAVAVRADGTYEMVDS